ncbi:hypothetical protein GCM10023321_38280 [Pseudonocardia eucalypti]|uniref:Uncharacterized protein n=1 Tax=Pseudonocardia eucalypti TaxID=648755 RepID=A0ABP9Q8N2_9PSEU
MVAAVAAAALAIIVGVIAFNAHRAQDQARPPGGGGQAGVPGHSLASFEMNQYLPEALRPAAPPAPVEAAGPAPVVSRATPSGGAVAAPPPPARGCSGSGIVGGLLNALGLGVGC